MVVAVAAPGAEVDVAVMAVVVGMEGRAVMMDPEEVPEEVLEEVEIAGEVEDGEVGRGNELDISHLSLSRTVECRTCTSAKTRESSRLGRI